MSYLRPTKGFLFFGLGICTIGLLSHVSGVNQPSYAQSFSDLSLISNTSQFSWKVANAEETAKILYQRAQIKAKANDYKGAVADYSEVIRLVPEYDKPYVFRANLRDALGDKDGALQDYAQAISLNPTNPLAYYNRAVTLSNMKKHNEAIADYDQTLRLKPGFVSAHKNRGLNYLAVNNIEGAVNDFQIASKLYKEAGNSQAHQQMQQLLKALGQ